jgi:hypothetical protein
MITIDFNANQLRNASSNQEMLEETNARRNIEVTVNQDTDVTAVNQSIARAFGIDSNKYSLSLSVESNRCCNRVLRLFGCAQQINLEEDNSSILGKIDQSYPGASRVVLKISPRESLITEAVNALFSETVKPHDE